MLAVLLIKFNSILYFLRKLSTSLFSISSLDKRFLLEIFSVLIFVFDTVCVLELVLLKTTK
jgi:hypothetical protein